MKDQNTIGHLTAIVTVLFWGTTFISTKVLLVDFAPLEILFFRFVMGTAALWLAYPHRMKGTTAKQELTFLAAGFSGVSLYYLFENMALTYTLASNVGVVVSAAPFFTAILAQIFLKGEEKLKGNFFIGFIVAMTGISLISFNGAKMELNPIGDLLAVGAAILWAFYSIFIRKINGYGYPTIQATRKIFVYGILGMLPLMPFSDFHLGLERFYNPVYVFNFFFLGLGASAVCFVTWNFATKVLGVLKSSVYIYLVPVVTVVFSVLILHEKITMMAVLGTILTLSGLVVSELKIGKKK